MSIGIRRVIFLMFIVSGFCGLLYQVIWIRIAYASFGIITPVMSVVISVFMLGLLLGSATGGPLVKKLVQRFRMSAILFYALAEFGIGLGAFCVPTLFSLEQHWLLSLGGMNSFSYLLVSGLAIAVALLPWCILMGFTYPFMMTFVRESDRTATSSFSFLYLANVIGAMTGTIVTAVVFIELFGFTHTLAIAAICNFAIAAASIAIAGRYPVTDVPGTATEAGAVPMEGSQKGFSIPALLFVSGFVAMCMEIIWTRNFTPVLRTVVYSYASLLATYLFATWIGSYFYRRHLSRSKAIPVETLLGAVALFSLLPLIVNDPRLPFKGIITVLLSITPLCGSLGYLTPQLVDRYSKGSPSAAGWAYAVNTFGCILGPLFASYLFLPAWGVKVSLLLLSTVLMACFAVYSFRSTSRKGWSVAVTVVFVVLFSTGGFFNDTFEEYFHVHSKSEMRRDYAATVTSLGTTVADKRLLVNGIGMTCLTPITQFMAHLPLAYCEKPPSSALVICFGMGTTFRSLVSWGINATAVELIPGVPKAFGYYWPDADSILRNPRAEIVIDDGRRYLMRTDKKFDVITIDPPPPVEAAGSSLLYSVEMYNRIKQRLKEDGILQIWLPGGEKPLGEAVARSIALSFPYVKVFGSIENWGDHFLASMKPIRQLSAVELVSRMPAKARQDLLTWCPNGDLEQYMQAMLSKEVPLDSMLSKDTCLMITDAKPYNEYFLLRRMAGRGKGLFKSLLVKNIVKLIKNPIPN
jgi:predicted membrane-bound spermidine synthase